MKPKDQHDPKRETREKVEHPEEIEAVENAGHYRNDIPSCVGKNPGVCLQAACRQIIDFHLDAQFKLIRPWQMAPASYRPGGSKRAQPKRKVERKEGSSCFSTGQPRVMVNGFSLNL
jgi:hypothetical protein